MDEQTEKLFNEYLTSLLRAVEKGVDFAVEQIPLVIQEKLTFSFYEHLLYLCIWTMPVLFIVGFLLLSRRKLYKNNNSDWPKLAACGFIVFCCGLLPIGYNIVALLEISLAPRLYLLEWLREML